MGGILPDQPGGTSLDFGLLTDLFAVTSDGGIPFLSDLTQPFVENFLKQREIKENPGWLGAHEAGFFGLIPGVPLIANIFMTLINSITGLPLGTWPGSGPLGFLGEIPNLIADVGNFFFNLTGIFGSGVDFNELLFDPLQAIFNFVDTMIVPTDLLASLIGGFIPGFQIPGLDASKIVSGFFPISMISGLAGQLSGLTSQFQSILNTAWEALVGDDEGAIDRQLSEFASALQNIPALNVIGVGAATMVDTVTDLLDNFWRGLSRATGSGKSPADVANAATATADQADTAVQIGEWNNAVLGLRNNKSLFEGVDETEEANYSIQTLWGVGTEPVAAYAATSTSVPVAYFRAKEVAKKGFISWFGKGITNVTALFIDIYKANYDTNTWELIYTSPDVIGMATGSWQYLIHNIAEADRIDIVSGDVIGVGWRVTGTGTHSIAGIPIAGMPEHPSIHPKKPVSARTGSGNLAFGSTAYTANTVPWFGIGIVEGDVPPPFFAPRQTQYTTTGTHNYEIPLSATHLDVVLIGAGGGGQGGSTFSLQHGEGGDAGTWMGETLVRGVDFPEAATELTITVGTGGNGGPAGSGDGAAGQASTRAAITGGKAVMTAAGGPGGNAPGSTSGDSAGDFTYNGVTYAGGVGLPVVGGQHGRPGGAPGAGGAGGSGGTWGVGWSGGKGGRGGAWVTARQA